MSVGTSRSVVKRFMPFDSLCPMLNNKFFASEVDWIAKEPIVIDAQTFYDAFRMSCDTSMEILN
jgi:hypothetical protein